MTTRCSSLPISEKIRWLCRDLAFSFGRYVNPSSRLHGSDIRKSAEEYLSFLCKRGESLTSEEDIECRTIINKAVRDFDEITSAYKREM